MGKGSSTICPAVVIRPSALQPPSVNHSAPSGPGVISRPSHPTGYSVGAPGEGAVFEEEGVVFLVRFAEEDDGARGETVLEGVLGGAGFAFGGDGTARDLAPLMREASARESFLGAGPVGGFRRRVRRRGVDRWGVDGLRGCPLRGFRCWWFRYPWCRYNPFWPDYCMGVGGWRGLGLWKWLMGWGLGK